MLDRPSNLIIPPNTDLVGIALTLKPERDLILHPQHTTQLHGWFLDRIRQIDPELSQQLHDGQGEKAFTISQLQGSLAIQGKVHLNAQNTYQWQVTALSRSLCDGLRQWLDLLPSRLELNSGNYLILTARSCYPPTTYAEIWQQSHLASAPLELTFTSPTSFRKRGNHLPLPIPENLFHSYLRRWNHFATEKFEQEPFLAWVNECVVILRHDIRSTKVQAGKRGSVTGFVGSVQLGLTTKAQQQPAYVQLVHALIACAPYFNTGHKVTFGLGQTQLGWDVWADLSPNLNPVPPVKRARGGSATPILPKTLVQDRSIDESPQKQSQLNSTRTEKIAVREQELEPFFRDLKKRQGGERASKTAKLWAQIIARLEMGDKLKSIAIDLNLPYETVKKYAQIAKKQLQPDKD
jgi:CRISPR-associated endoribonuclease Cas6